MTQSRTVQLIIFCSLVFFSCARLGASEPEAISLEQQVSGLWLYTGLTTKDGKDLPLNGIFLFKDGLFVQYAAFNGEPVPDQGAMAHAGAYSIGQQFVTLMADQTISTAPGKTPPLTSRGQTEHHIAVSRTDQDLTLVFSRGTGTVQLFERAGPGSGEVLKLAGGMLALVDGYFVLVHEDENGVNTGYGNYQNQNGSMSLNIIRWTSADQASASNVYDTSMKASFDGQSLSLEDGRSFQVSP